MPQGKEWHAIITIHCSEKIKLHVKKVIDLGRGKKDGCWSSEREEKMISSCIGACCSFRHSSHFLSSRNISQY